jgi:hypothetical protein
VKRAMLGPAIARCSSSALAVTRLGAGVPDATALGRYLLLKGPAEARPVRPTTITGPRGSETRRIRYTPQPARSIGKIESRAGNGSGC